MLDYTIGCKRSIDALKALGIPNKIITFMLNTKRFQRRVIVTTGGISKASIEVKGGVQG